MPQTPYLPPPSTPPVLCGAPGGSLQDATASVEAARGVVEALFTAPLPRLVTREELDRTPEDEEEGEGRQGGMRRKVRGGRGG